MSSILERLGLTDGAERQITLGKSFNQNADSEYHTFRYDFKPASVDATKKSTVDIGERNQVTVTVPHVDKGTGTTHTVFKGSKKPYHKECVLIIDHKTGEITLERLSYNVQLKRTRGEGCSRISQSFLENNLTTKKSPVQRRSPQQKSLLSSSSSSAAVSKSSPLSKSPNRQSQSSPPSRASPSVPCIAPSTGVSSLAKHSSQSSVVIPSTSKAKIGFDSCEIGILTSSESSSDSGSLSDCDSGDEKKQNARLPVSAHNNSQKMTNGSGGKLKGAGNGTSSVYPASNSFGKSSAVIKNGTTPRSGSPILSRFPQKTSGPGFMKMNGNSLPHSVKGNGCLPKVNGNISPSFKVNGKTNFPKKVVPVSHPTPPILCMPKFSQLSEDLKLSESDSDD